MMKEAILIIFLIFLFFTGILYLSWKHHRIGTKRFLILLIVSSMLLAAYRSFTHFERTKNWETYRDETYDFEFRYPKGSNIRAEMIHDDSRIIEVSYGQNTRVDEGIFRILLKEERGTEPYRPIPLKYWTLIGGRIAEVRYIYMKPQGFQLDSHLHKDISLHYRGKYFDFSGDLTYDLFWYAFPLPGDRHNREVSRDILRTFHFFH